jgi:hypothetical protein
MKLKYSNALCAVLLLCVGTVAVAEDEAKSNIESADAAATKQAVPEDFSDQQALADQLLRYAEENRDAVAALAAARILTRIPGGALFSPIEEPTSSPVEQKPLFNYSKLDAKSTPGAARRSIDKALDMALGFAGEDAGLKKQIEAARKTDFQMYASTCYAYNDFGQWFWWTAGNRAIARRQVMQACRFGTPYGYRCFNSHCD